MLLWRLGTPDAETRRYDLLLELLFGDFCRPVLGDPPARV